MIRCHKLLEEKMGKLVLAAVVAATLTGCASPKFNYMPESKAFSEPAIGSIATASVGDKMLSQGLSIKQDAIEVKNDFNISMGQIVGNGIYLKTGYDDAAEYFTPKLGDGGGKLTRTSFIFDHPQSLMLRKDNTLCVITITTQYVCGTTGEASSHIERKQVDQVTERSFQQTLLYSGRSGNKINIGYREFSANVARMGFNNDVEYDLNESKTIGYKGAEIEVLEATNRFIRYKVLRNFNGAMK